MNDLERQERLLDLLTQREISRLNKDEEQEMKDLLDIFPEWRDDETLSITAAAINLSAVGADEEMPAHLQAKILASADQYFSRLEESKGKVLEFEPRQKTAPEVRVNAAQDAGEGFFGRLFKTYWLGWAVAGAACLALAFNVWTTRNAPPQIVQNTPVQTTPAPPGLAQQREQLLASAKDVVTTSWTDIDPKKPFNVQGDVVWSNAEQRGYMRFRNMPVNDRAKETYQLWIFDENQDTKTPVDGGVFDVDANGDVIIPIDAKIKVQKPVMFAVTAEKPGGVVVSKREKVLAIAKVEA